MLAPGNRLTATEQPINPPSHIPLAQGNLPQLARLVTVPAYDRRQLSAGLVHIGVGGFNRSHQAVYLDDLLAQAFTRQKPLCWAECGIGLRPPDRRMLEVLKAQGYLYTLVERDAAKSAARIVGSICDYIYAPAAIDAAIERMASPECRIVSLTVTEGGYFTSNTTGEFDPAHPQIVHDLEHPHEPFTFVGLLCVALDRRRLAGLPPFTVMSCDNLQGNGDVTRNALCAFADLTDPQLRRWIEQSVTCPNSMVDRITPSTTEEERRSIEQSFRVRDGWPVVTEPFRQWILEDLFCNGRPRWEDAGVVMTHDVEPYELMKMRLLNGSHFALAYLCAMLGFEFVHEVLQDKRMRSFLVAYMDAVTPTVPAPPYTNLQEYKSTLLDRFSNPTIRDQLLRICSEGSAKIGKFVLPVASALLQLGRDTRMISLVVASWLHAFRFSDSHGQSLAMTDARTAEIQHSLADMQSDPASIYKLRAVFPQEFVANTRLVAEIQEMLASLEQVGVQATVDRVVSHSSVT